MAALSDYAEKLLLDYSMTTGSVTRPTAWYVALYTSAPSDAGGGTEVSGGGYANQVGVGVGSSGDSRSSKQQRTWR